MIDAPRRPTIADVAQRAGVSVSTVSHTFSGNRPVAAATRRQVRAAAVALGYQPDPIAQRLRRNRLGVIALVARSLDRRLGLVDDVYYYLQIAGAAAMAAMAAGYGVMLVSDPNQPGASGAALACDGVIVTEPDQDDRLVAGLRATGIPLVTVGTVPGLEPDPDWMIDIDAVRLTKLALDHLLQRGANRIAMVNGSDPNDWCQSSASAYRQWTRELDLPYLTVAANQDLGPVGGRQAVAQLEVEAERLGIEAPDGYYCLTAAHALGVCDEMRERGIDVPGQVKVIAGSDSERCRTAQPALTALDLEPALLARRAIATMLAILAAKPSPKYPAEVGLLIQRASTQ